jgi:transposase InsO family protein
VPHHARRGETVCKSTVQNWLRRHALAAQTVRRQTRNRVPRYVRPNHCWGVDGTGKRDGEGREHFILGIIDHGTRRVLKLVALEQGTSRAILTELFDAVHRFGKPNMIRTDNGSVFTSDELHQALIAADIRQWRTGIAMPWQNGRIERLFGTLKEKLNQITPSNFAALNLRLDEFVFWYNVVRPHQHLFGLTPMGRRGVVSIHTAVRRGWSCQGPMMGTSGIQD